MLAACERIASEEWGYEEMFLYVKRENTAALCLYYSAGYVCEWQAYAQTHTHIHTHTHTHARM